jgi:hypothetical protein
MKLNSGYFFAHKVNMHKHQTLTENNVWRFQMQERFCDCGKRLFVEYLFGTISWLPVFHASADPAAGNVHACPGCGRRLDIHALS